MTGQGQPVSGSSAWSTVFRHVRYENLVAGVSGGVLSNLALHPLDLVKIRFAGKPAQTLAAPRAVSPTWV
jgi:solute carrier family 25 folate transporter 32